MTLKLQIYEELDGFLRDLETAAAMVHLALRSHAITAAPGSLDKTKIAEVLMLVRYTVL